MTARDWTRELYKNMKECGQASDCITIEQAEYELHRMIFEGWEIPDDLTPEDYCEYYLEAAEDYEWGEL